MLTKAHLLPVLECRFVALQLDSLCIEGKTSSVLCLHNRLCLLSVKVFSNLALLLFLGRHLLISKDAA
jgi:hypothetical protein